MLFVRPRCNQLIDVPLPAVKGIYRVQHITALGVTLSHNFMIALIKTIIKTACLQYFENFAYLSQKLSAVYNLSLSLNLVCICFCGALFELKVKTYLSVSYFNWSLS